MEVYRPEIAILSNSGNTAVAVSVSKWDGPNLLFLLDHHHHFTIMNSLQDSVKIPLMQDHEYPVEKHDSSQEDEPFQLSNSSNNRKRFAGRVVFALFAVVAGALVASKLFGVSFKRADCLTFETTSDSNVPSLLTAPWSSTSSFPTSSYTKSIRLQGFGSWRRFQSYVFNSSRKELLPSSIFVCRFCSY